MSYNNLYILIAHNIDIYVRLTRPPSEIATNIEARKAVHDTLDIEHKSTRF